MKANQRKKKSQGITKSEKKNRGPSRKIFRLKSSSERTESQCCTHGLSDSYPRVWSGRGREMEIKGKERTQENRQYGSRTKVDPPASAEGKIGKIKKTMTKYLPAKHEGWGIKLRAPNKTWGWYSPKKE